ncbi:hypothetical protein [Streptomyces sp. NRRL S-350]|nr:hypothetical protein [Streptomyces sp. NRRL S-350]
MLLVGPVGLRLGLGLFHGGFGLAEHGQGARAVEDITVTHWQLITS